MPLADGLGILLCCAADPHETLGRQRTFVQLASELRRGHAVVAAVHHPFRRADAGDARAGVELLPDHPGDRQPARAKAAEGLGDLGATPSTMSLASSSTSCANRTLWRRPANARRRMGARSGACLPASPRRPVRPLPPASATDLPFRRPKDHQRARGSFSSPVQWLRPTCKAGTRHPKFKTKPVLAHPSCAAAAAASTLAPSPLGLVPRAERLQVRHPGQARLRIR